MSLDYFKSDEKWSSKMVSCLRLRRLGWIPVVTNGDKGLMVIVAKGGIKVSCLIYSVLSLDII